jgi:hypothetical protein
MTIIFPCKKPGLFEEGKNQMSQRRDCMRTYINGLIVFVLVIADVHGEKTEPGLFTSQAVGASYNPLGLLVDSKLLYTSRLFQKSGILWESTKLRLGLQNEFTPADNLFSLRAECEPVAFFDVTVKCGVFSMFNTLGYGCFRMSTFDEPYDLKTQDRTGRGNALGYWASVSPTLKARAGRIIALNTLNVDRIAINGEGRFLELHSYLPHKTSDLDLVNNTLLLYENSAMLLTGLSFKNTYVDGTSLFSQMLSGMAILKSAPTSTHRQFLLINAGAYLQDPLFAKSVYLACMAGRDFKLR